MPRMSKKRKEELTFFLNDCNRITYNPLCRKCTHKCKQSFRVAIIDCPSYLSKRAVKSPAELPRGPTDTPSALERGCEP